MYILSSDLIARTSHVAFLSFNVVVNVMLHYLPFRSTGEERERKLKGEREEREKGSKRRETSLVFDELLYTIQNEEKKGESRNGTSPSYTEIIKWESTNRKVFHKIHKKKSNPPPTEEP